MTILYSDPLDALQEVFGYSFFRGGQEDIINAVIMGRDVIGVLPTGGGKSMCYQIPALCMPGTAIVISPLIALMKDQVEAALSRGIGATYINSSLTIDEVVSRLQLVASGKCNLLYVSPERLISQEFISLLKNIKISFFAIDEAHCISSWGHDFRLSYRKISGVIDQIESCHGYRLPRLALTATANEYVFKDIIAQLEMRNPFSYVGDFDRPNIFFEVIESNNKSQDIIDRIRQDIGSSTIVYCSTISTAESLYSDLIRSGINAGIYHSRLPSEVKGRVQDDFLHDSIDVLVSTNAFGMGVDKPNIRNVIHYHMPSSIEAFYQEAGRAGRNGEPSKSTIFYHKNDSNIHKFFIDSMYPDEKSILAVLYVLSAFYSGEAMSFSLAEISRYSSISLKDNQVDSILKILADQGIISIGDFHGKDKIRAIDIIDLSIPVKTDILMDRKSVVMENLKKMERYCNTRICRRSFILGYFSGKSSYSFCGDCDVCLKREQLKDDTVAVYSDESIRSVLKLASIAHGIAGKNLFVEMLLGLNKKYFTSTGLSDLNGFGALSSWSIQDVSRLLDKLISQGYLSCDSLGSGAILIEKTGSELLAGDEPIMSVVRSVALQNSIYKPACTENNFKESSEDSFKMRYNLLVELREVLSKKHALPAFMIYSNEMIERIVSSRPESESDLERIGLTGSRLKNYGGHIISTLNGGVLKERPSEFYF